MTDSTYNLARSVADAVEMLAELPYAVPLAGGQTLVPELGRRPAGPVSLVDLRGVPELAGIRRGSVLSIGAMSTHHEVAHDPEVFAAVPRLASAVGRIADPVVARRATIGGALADNDPGGDYPALCLALAGTIVTDRRRLVADEFFSGPSRTALGRNELVTAMEFPVPEAFGFARLANPGRPNARAGVALARTPAGPRVAITGLGAIGVFRWRQAEEALSGSWSAAALDGLTLREAPGPTPSRSEPLSDYDANIASVLARRALT